MLNDQDQVEAVSTNSRNKRTKTFSLKQHFSGNTVLMPCYVLMHTKLFSCTFRHAHVNEIKMTLVPALFLQCQSHASLSAASKTR